MAYLSNVAIVRKMLDVIEQGLFADIENIFAPNWVNHDPSLPPMQGLEGARMLVGLWSGGLSKTKVTIEDSVTEGDRVAVRFKIMGTNSGEMMGIPATGRLINVVGTGIFRVVDGKVTDNWINFDALGMMQQLGVVPLPQRPG
jgi:predicted ester cyclase